MDGKDYLGNPVVGGWIIRKLIFEKYSVRIRRRYLGL
jgi:hypothetical protein